MVKIGHRILIDYSHEKIPKKSDHRSSHQILAATACKEEDDEVEAERRGGLQLERMQAVRQGSMLDMPPNPLFLLETCSRLG